MGKLITVDTDTGEILDLINYAALPGKATAVGLILTEGLSFDRWAAVGRAIAAIEGRLMWYVGDWLNYGERTYGETYSQAMDATGLEYQTVRNAKWVTSRIDLSFRKDSLSFSHHMQVASLPDDERDRLLAEAERDELTVSELRERAKVARHGITHEPTLVAGTKYGCIVIDPPWEMEKIERVVAPNQVGFDYPTMTEAELAAFPVPDMAGDDCHLFCWTTHKHLPQALRLIEVWGFHYVLCMVWHKSGGFQPWNLPQYNCEFVVYARKGAPKFIDTKQFFTCFNGKRREHSRKPDEFYDVIRRVTDGSRIDVFSREAREGFAQWGNETGKFAA